MSEHEVVLEVGMIVVANERGEAAINRYVNLSPEDAREIYCTPGLTREEVERTLCQTVLRTGLSPERLDGWADLEPGDLDVRIDYVQEF